MTDLALRRIEENKRTEAPFLDLGNCGLKHELPSELAECTWLKGLNLGRGYYNEKGYWESSLNKGRNNEFIGQELAILEKLPQLQKLYLQSTQLTDISNLSGLRKLQTLDLSDNQLTDIRPLSSLINLQELYLTNNQLTDIRPLSSIINLLELSLSNNQLKDISTLSSLGQLQELYLTNNRLKNISPLSRLGQLQILVLNHNQLTDISSLNSLVNLKILDLSNNQLTDISPLNSLIQLQKLHLDLNQILDISSLSTLSQLHTLYISYNKIQDIKPLRSLDQLYYLSINNNPVIFKNGLTLPPSDNHLPVIKNLLAREVEETPKTNIILPAKVLLLGNHGSGKSSLLHFLQTDKHSYKGNSTHVLKVEAYPKDSATPEAIFYDFGGQDYYHGIYRAFLSSGSVYLLLWQPETNYTHTSTDTNQLLNHHFSVPYWLGMKRHLEKQAPDPVLLIQTHATADAPPLYPTIAPNKGVENRFYVCLNEKDDFAQNKASLAYLKASVQALITRKRIIKQESAWYVAFLKHIFQAQDIQAVDIHSLRKVYTPQNKTGEAQMESLRVELEQLHNQGMVLYYPEIDKNKVWLNPVGLVAHIHEHILKREVLEHEFDKGVAPEQLMQKHDANLIALLEKQKVIFKHLYGNSGTEYIFPNFLPLAETQALEYDLLTFGLGSPLFVLKFGEFLPIGLINQLICFFGRQPEKKKFWRNQLLFTFEKCCKVLIQLDFKNLEIRVLAFFKDRQHEQEPITKYLFYCILAMYWGDIEPQEYAAFREGRTPRDKPEERMQPENLLDNAIFCPEDLYISRDDKFFISYADLVKTTEPRATISSYRKQADETLDTSPIEIPVKQFQAFTNKPLQKMKRIFISYSNKDITFKQELEEYLKPLAQFQLAKSWSCEELTPGLWHEQIQDELQKADIIVFMLSINFVNSDYIMKEEFYKTIGALKKESNKQVVCVLVKHFPWESFSKMAELAGIDKASLESALKDPDNEHKTQVGLATITDYQFLPYYTENKGDASRRFLQPINKWEYREDAYTQIAEKIMTVLP
ncbi:leucine-rich repeat domain-containing protein [Emticicia sp. 17c]|uniref:leucine-rich repeat domain-containing protein n=1 Tax=Emticicia sp. 17c TaxID=3127704 RepID=UPI00301D9934